jgi:hypothetical protein
MPIRLNVSLSGIEPFRARMDAAVQDLGAAVFDATVEGSDAIADAIIAASPERTGRLRQSWKTSVVRTPTGARGTISSSLRYARFVDRGTREHGKAQHMTERGIVTATPAVEAIYRSAVDKVVVSIA